MVSDELLPPCNASMLSRAHPIIPLNHNPSQPDIEANPDHEPIPEVNSHWIGWQMPEYSTINSLGQNVCHALAGSVDGAKQSTHDNTGRANGAVGYVCVGLRQPVEAGQTAWTGLRKAVPKGICGICISSRRE